METPRNPLPDSLNEVMEMLWPRIGGLWSGAMVCLAELLNGANLVTRDNVLAMLEPAEAMLRRALVLLAHAQGIDTFFSLPSFSLGGGGIGLADPAEDTAPNFRLTEPDLGTLDDGAGQGEPVPATQAPAPPSPPTGPHVEARDMLALQKRLEALDAALEDPFTHVKRMGKLLWRAGEDETPPPVNLISGAMMTPEARPETVELLTQLNTRACHALWHPPP